ncbi:Anthranilate phosphoribosyltransferase [compost metagenome]
MGLRAHSIKDVAGGDAQLNAEIIRHIFAGEKGPYRDIVLANAAACFYVTGHVGTLQQGVKLAADVIDSGRAEQKLSELIQYTGELCHVS